MNRNLTPQALKKFITDHKHFTLNSSPQDQENLKNSIKKTPNYAPLTINYDSNPKEQSNNREPQITPPPLTNEDQLNSHWFQLNKTLCQQSNSTYLTPLRLNNKPSTPTYISFNSPFIEPKWTQPEISTTIITNYITEADKLIGVEKTNFFLLTVGFDRTYFTDPSNWVSLSFLNEFINYTSQYCNSTHLQKRAGKELILQEITKNYLQLAFTFNAHSGLRKLKPFFSKINRTAIYNYEKKSPTMGWVTISIPSGKEPLLSKIQLCEYWKSILETYIQLITNSQGQTLKLTCFHKDNENCTYQVTFRPHLWKKLLSLNTLSYLIPRREKTSDTLNSKETVSLSKYEELQELKKKSRHAP